MKKLISVIILICFINLAHGQNKMYTLLIDTYVSSSSNDGIYVYDFNSQNGDYKFKTKVAGEDKPSYLTTSIDGKYVYSVNEVSNGSISAYALNSKTGELRFLNRAGTGGDSPCYAVTDAKNKILFAGNYGSGSISVYSLKEDGSIGNTLQFIQNEGSSIDKRRQSGPHVHGTVLSPDEKFLLSPDLGTDRVNVYRFDPNNLVEPLTPADPVFVPVKAVREPRHLIFHPNSKYAYLTHEMGGIITVFDKKNGKLSEKQTSTMQAPDFNGRNGGADILISEDGRFLYASNRGDANELIIYSINKRDGKLECISHRPSKGKLGIQYISYSHDVGIFTDACSKLLKELSSQ